MGSRRLRVVVLTDMSEVDDGDFAAREQRLLLFGRHRGGRCRYPLAVPTHTRLRLLSLTLTVISN